MVSLESWCIQVFFEQEAVSPPPGALCLPAPEDNSASLWDIYNNISHFLLKRSADPGARMSFHIPFGDIRHLVFSDFLIQTGEKKSAAKDLPAGNAGSKKEEIGRRSIIITGQKRSDSLDHINLGITKWTPARISAFLSARISVLSAGLASTISIPDINHHGYIDFGPAASGYPIAAGNFAIKNAGFSVER